MASSRLGAKKGEGKYSKDSYLRVYPNRREQAVEVPMGLSMTREGRGERLPVARAVLLLLVERGDMKLGEILSGLERLRERGLVEPFTREEVERVLGAWQALGVLRNGDGRYVLTEQARKHWYTEKLKEMAKAII